MEFDPSTLFVVVVAATFANAVLLVWAWSQNRGERAILWTAIGYACAAVGNVLLAGRDSMPDFLTIDIANAFIIYGLGQLWVMSRLFNRRRVSQWIPIGGAAVWLVAVQIPAIGDTYEARIILASVLAGVFCMMAAVELRVSDGLRSRVPVMALLVFHAIMLMVRIPIVLIESSPDSVGFESPWFAPIALETLVFAQALAVLILSLTKERAEQLLRTMALTDPLTGLANRRAFFEEGERLIAAACRAGQPTSLIAFDLDQFKRVNDTMGHPFGDRVLEAFAQAAREGVRSADLAGRIGGEEFAVVLPGADEEAARRAAARVVQLFAERVGPSANARIQFTASAGLMVAPTSEETITAMFIEADRALYEAKNSGGNQLRVATPLAA